MATSTTLTNLPKTPSTAAQNEAVQSKRDLTSWWKNFKRGNLKTEEHKEPQGIFGVPLAHSIRYANVAISLFDENGESYIYGYVPIVVAKCGVFLKEKATSTEGIFRLAGSEKRIKELKSAFDSPDKYGKGLDWAGYTVHDAANILRRYFNQLPEPIIPLEFYERFREPLRTHQQQVAAEVDPQGGNLGGADAEVTINSYKGLITELPQLNRQLLLYILDLLAVFASNSEQNKMTTPNLSAIFQPGILSHPQHDMAPQEYRLSQDVLIFLIENQESFLIGMHGTAADEKTVKEVQSGYQPRSQSGSPTGTPTRSKTLVSRTTSGDSTNSQGGMRNFSNLRRNMSSSSRTSRKSSNPAANAAFAASPGLGGGVHRSNTVPSQRPAADSPRFSGREKQSEPPSPLGGLPSPLENVAAESEEATTPATDRSRLQLQPPKSLQITAASPPESVVTTPLAAPGGGISSAILVSQDGGDTHERSALLTPESAKRDASIDRAGGSRTFLDVFRQGGSPDERQQRKLQKKRIPGSVISSAASSANDLGHGADDTADPVPSPLHSPAMGQHREVTPLSDYRLDQSAQSVQGTPPLKAVEALRAVSPQPSMRSRASATDASEGEFLEEHVAAEKQEKKRRWRFSHSAKSRHAEGTHDALKAAQPAASPPTTVSTANSPDASRNNSTAVPSTGVVDAAAGSTQESRDSEEKKRGPVSWIKGKIQERKEKEAEKRAKSPSGTNEKHDERQAGSAAAEETTGPTPAPSDSPGEVAKVDTLQPLGKASGAGPIAATPAAAEVQPAQAEPLAVPSAQDGMPAAEQANDKTAAEPAA